jgi:3'-phosphoadenosine 5'-phosphosulfate (PAPS) 3'-phosphatase
MSLNKENLIELCEFAKKAALSAGKLIASKQGSIINVQSKEGGENLASCVVTEIDFKAQEIILDILEPTLTKFDLGLLTEESDDDSSRFEKDYFWCIDPLDGTLAFSRNEDGYSTSIALISKNGIPTIGVVFNPRSNCLYYAIKNHGAFKNDLALKVRDSSKDLTLLFDQSYLSHPKYEQQIKKLRTDIKDLGLNELSIHPLGGAVMNAISTIEFAPAVYYKFPKEALGGGSLWDFAASSVIQSEAGGFNRDFHKNPLELNRSESSFMNHRGVIYSSSEELLNLIPNL